VRLRFFIPFLLSAMALGQACTNDGTGNVCAPSTSANGKWMLINHASDTGSGDLGCYSDKKIAFATNALTITMTKPATSPTCGLSDTTQGTQLYLSGAMASVSSFSPTTSCPSGTCTIQASIEAGKGWPAFWLLGGAGLLSSSSGCQYQSVYNTWDNVGNCHWSTDTMPNGDSAEIDIMEYIEPSYTNTNQNLFSNLTSQQNTSQTLSSSISNFHVYSMQWSNSSITYSVDGTASTAHYTSNVPQNPMFILLQNRVSNGAAPATFPQTMTVQYVQVCDGTTCTSPGTSGGNTVFFDNFTPGPQTWYVRPDGGTRYNAHGAPATFGQCDGLSDTAYTGTTNAVWTMGVVVAPGTTITGNTGFYETTTAGGTSGVTIPAWGTTTTDGTVTWTKGAAYPQNGHCAFSDIRYLWADGEYSAGGAAPQWGWTSAGGDTVIVRGAHTQTTGYRIGYSGPNNTSADYFLGEAGNPGGSGAPVVPSGTVGQPTRILGENYASCTNPLDKTFVHGGYGTGGVFNVSGSSYVQIECFNISDQSSCGRSGTVNNCNTSFPMDDYANNGIEITNTATNVLLQDIDIHGMASAGMHGPTGDGFVTNRVSLIGNDNSGWNLDRGNGTTGTGSLTNHYFTCGWNGFNEQYPILDALPFFNGSDDSSSGYGDCWGTTTVASVPGWQVSFDHANVFYNTQDGLDALHVNGAGSTVTIIDSLLYGNMGNQAKIGGSAITFTNNLIYDNCNALRQAIPGTPSGYNTALSDFCRAGDDAVAVTISDAYNSLVAFNTLVTAASGGYLIECVSPCTAPAFKFQNNVTLGFLNNATNGYPGGGSGNYPQRIYLDTSVTPGAAIWLDAGSAFDHNDTFHEKNACPNTNETNALCVDPLLTTSTWSLYGTWPITLTSSSPPIGAGVTIPGITADYLGVTRPNPPSIGAYEFLGAVPTSLLGAVVITGAAVIR